MHKTLKLLFLTSTGAAILSGCSLFQADSTKSENLNYLSGIVDTTQPLFESNRGRDIVRNVVNTNPKTTSKALKDSPSEYQALSSLLRDYKSDESWLPQFNKLHVLEHYKEAVLIDESLSKRSPIEVRMNDEVILVIIPNQWIWGKSYNEISPQAKRDLSGVAEILSDSRSNIFVKSIPSSSGFEMNRATTRDAQSYLVEAYLEKEARLDANTVKSVSTPNMIALDSIYSDSTIIEVRHTFSLNSTEYLPENGPL
ncbi:hypothetical protein [Marinomonas sp. 2405UD68-3]|uniref:hypothetical protein n=1 Tax=Marinomonas sp. 2405UD68-3 TaxID=3391835 RepID=UPI0039C92A8E